MKKYDEVDEWSTLTVGTPLLNANAEIPGSPARGCECHSDEPLTTLSVLLSVGAGPGHLH